MSRPKAMGIGAMLVLLVAAVIILPMIVRYINRMEPHFVISGFQDLAAAEAVSQGDSVRVPAHVTSNNSFVSDTPNNSGQSCPEGTFYDKSSNSCVSIYAGGAVPEVGYFS